MKLDFIDKPINPPGPYRFTVVSIFAGCGGSSLGYKWAGGNVVAAIEWDDNAVATYRCNHQGTHIFHRDIAMVSIDEVITLTGLDVGELDILDGSPPCQGFSTAGKRQIDDPRNQLFREYVRLLAGLRPKVFVMENVSGMIKGKMKLLFVEILKELKAQGYRVSARLLNTMYFGVPQSRECMIFIGVRDDLGIEPSHPKAQTRPIVYQDAVQRLDAIDQRAKLPSSLRAQRWIETKRGDAHRERFSLLRLSWHKTAPTLLKVSGSGGHMHPDEPRLLHVGELRRIASFPDAFKFVGTWDNAVCRMGNTVPPRFMQAIAEHIYDNILSKFETGIAPVREA
jgi:DNA (cytosine-5)-methyltransferase 1